MSAGSTESEAVKRAAREVDQAQAACAALLAELAANADVRAALLAYPEDEIVTGESLEILAEEIKDAANAWSAATDAMLAAIEADAHVRAQAKKARQTEELVGALLAQCSEDESGNAWLAGVVPVALEQAAAQTAERLRAEDAAERKALGARS